NDIDTIFFFSSRRRHTRSKRDWSSDVCSSDLFDGNEIDRPTFKVDMDANAADKGAYPYYMLKEIDEQPAVMRKLVQEYFGDNDVDPEERRVGKECRARGAW